MVAHVGSCSNSDKGEEIYLDFAWFSCVMLQLYTVTTIRESVF